MYVSEEGGGCIYIDEIVVVCMDVKSGNGWIRKMRDDTDTIQKEEEGLQKQTKTRETNSSFGLLKRPPF